MKYFQPGSFKTIPNINHIKGLKSQIQSVYIWICTHLDDNLECFPSINLLAKEAGVDKKTVFKCIKELENIGILEKFQRKAGKIMSSNLYRVILKDDINSLSSTLVGETTLPSTIHGTTPTPSDGSVTISNITISNNTSDFPEKIAEESISSKNQSSLVCDGVNSPQNPETPSFEEWCALNGYSEDEFYSEDSGPEDGFSKDGKQAKSKPVVKAEYDKFVKSKNSKVKVIDPIIQVFSLFKEINSTSDSWYQNTTQRKAAKFLFEIYGIEKIKKALAFYGKNKDNQFIPIVNTPDALLKKYENLRLFRNKSTPDTFNTISIAEDIIL